MYLSLSSILYQSPKFPCCWNFPLFDRWYTLLIQLYDEVYLTWTGYTDNPNTNSQFLFYLSLCNVLGGCIGRLLTLVFQFKQYIRLLTFLQVDYCNLHVVLVLVLVLISVSI
jgi:hypothetical protein